MDELHYCRYLLYEHNKTLFIKSFFNGKIQEEKIPLMGGEQVVDTVTTGHLSYNRFYQTLGKQKIENLKQRVSEMNITTEAEQLHWINPLYIDQPIYKDIYVYDINSSFPNGIMMLPNTLIDLKDYTMDLYTQKEYAKDKLERLQKKNLLNMLVGYFQRVNAFKPLRHQIIENSNDFISSYKATVERYGGIVYLINVDSIICDSVGASIMDDYLGEGIGKFKLQQKADRLYYTSNVVYQVGNTLKYAGKTLLEQENIDLFEGIDAVQIGKFIKGKDYNLLATDNELRRLCRYYTDTVSVIQRNMLGEIIGHKIYSIGGV